MPTPTKGPRLGGGPAHERLLLNNLATSLFIHKRIVTTETKAKRLRPLAERFVTFAKRGDLAARRRVLQRITDKNAVHELFANIAPQVAEREGGYTRITKLGYRKGDNAPMAVIELVLEPVTKKPSTNKTKLTNSVKANAAEAAEVFDEALTAQENELTEEVVIEAIEDAAPVEPSVEAETAEIVAEAVAEEAPAEEAPAAPAAEEDK